MARRSTGMPRGRVQAGITRIISARTSAKTIARPTETTGSLGDTQTTTSEHTESLWLFSPEERVVQAAAGERVTGDLAGLALADDYVDIQKDDRITHGGVEYEVDTVLGRPEDGQADGTASPGIDYWVISLIRRH